MPALVGVSPALLHAGVLPHCFALTLPCLPTRCGVGAKVFARVGLHLLWACLLAGGWGLVFALLPVFVWVFACLLGVVGQCGPAAPLPRLACLFACVLTPWCGLVGVCAAGACGVGAWAALLGRDNRVPPHTAWRGLLRSPCGAEERGVACGVLPVC